MRKKYEDIIIEFKYLIIIFSSMGDSKKDNKWIRRKILGYLYQKHEGIPGEWIDPKNELIELLKLEENRIDSNMHYLGEKGFVKLSKADSSTYMAKISASGIDLVEDTNQFNQLFPIQITQNIVKENHGGTIIGNGNVQNLNVGDNATYYKSSPRNYFFTEKASMTIVNKFGENNTKKGGIISSLVGLITIVTGLKSLVPESSLFSYWPIILENYASYLLYIGFGLFVIGAFLIQIVRYRHETKCPQCNSIYKFKPVGGDNIREVKASDGVHRTIFRNLECEKCGYSKKVEIPEFIPNEQLSEK